MVPGFPFSTYPIAPFLPDRLTAETRIYGLLLLAALALIWGWFWIRIVAGPDRRFRLAAVAGATILLTVFTLRTPPQYGSLFLYAVIMAGAALPPRRGGAAGGPPAGPARGDWVPPRGTLAPAPRPPRHPMLVGV